MTDQPLQAVPTAQPDELDQLEAQIRSRIEHLDKQIAEAKEHQKALRVRVGELTVIRDKAKRMLPRARRTRAAKVSSPDS